jgi:hypothetical protein
MQVVNDHNWLLSCVKILVICHYNYAYISELLCFSIHLTTEWNLPCHQCSSVKHRSGLTEMPAAVQLRSFFNMRIIGSKKKDYAGRKLVG